MTFRKLAFGWLLMLLGMIPEGPSDSGVHGFVAFQKPCGFSLLKALRRRSSSFVARKSPKHIRTPRSVTGSRVCMPG